MQYLLSSVLGSYATVGSDVGDKAVGEHAWHASLCAPTRGHQGGDHQVWRVCEAVQMTAISLLVLF